MKIAFSLSVLMIFWLRLPTSNTLRCHQEMGYHERYGYGYDISCTNLNRTNIDELKNITVYNEVRVSITQSDLPNLNPDLFQNIPKTRQIVIENSNVSFNEAPFVHLTHLEELTLLDANFARVPRSLFQGLSRLRALNLNRNKLQVVQNGTLEPLERLTTLDLSENLLESTTLLPICEVDQLKRLYLRNNRLKLLQLDCLKLLKNLFLDHNRLEQPTSFIHNRYLTEISFSYNRLEHLDHMFRQLENLEELNLEGNRLEAIGSSELSDLHALRKLNLKGNTLKTGAFSGLGSLEELDLSRNRLEGGLVLRLPRLVRLSLAYNKLSEFTCETCQLEALLQLDLEACNLTQLAAGAFTNFSRLESLNLANNRIAAGSLGFQGLFNLRTLNLSSNKLEALPDGAFGSTPKLLNLNLSGNLLTRLTNATLSGLEALEVLNLSYNRLEIFHESVVVSLRNLHTLDLEGNHLKSIGYDIIISLLSNLKLINVRENRLSCEFLAEMLLYFREKRINFTINEKLNYKSENVDGIQCREDDKLEWTDALLLNDSRVLDEIYRITKSGSGRSLSESLLVVGLVLLLFVCCVGVVCYKLFMRRRRYISDEIELLDTNRLSKMVCNGI